MSKKDIRAQAEQFIGYFSRLEDKKLEDAFRFWAGSKDFDKETERAIRREVDRILKAEETGLKDG